MRQTWGKGGYCTELGSTMIHHHSHPSSALCPLQPPASSLAARPRVTRWHWPFFFCLFFFSRVPQLHAASIQPQAAPRIYYETWATDWQRERQTRAQIGHKSFTTWQVPLNVDCFSGIFKPLVLLSVKTHVGCVQQENCSWIKINVFMHDSRSDMHNSKL